MDNIRSNQERFSALKQEYDGIRPRAKELAQQLCIQLEKALNRREISLGFPVQARVKEWESLLGKLERKADRYKTVSDVHDLVGLRITVLFWRDLEKVNTLIRELLYVIDEEDKSRELKEDQFGYKAIHFTATIREGWLSIPTFTDLQHIKTEIQVRTVAQHNWAAASHHLQYKREEDVPPSMRRSINRISALLEIVDLEFERLLTEQESYGKTTPISNLDEVLNVDLLKGILDRILPRKNRFGNEDYATLFHDLQRFNVFTTGALQHLANKHIDAALRYDESEVRKSREILKTEGVIVGVNTKKIDEGAFFSHTGLMHLILSHEFQDKYREIMYPIDGD